jgi:serine protease Do
MFHCFSRNALVVACLACFAVPAVGFDKNDFKDSPRIKAAFRKVVEQARRCVVEIECQVEKDKKKTVVLGTIVGPDGWILTKASELKGQIVCKLRGKGQHVARIVGVNEENDLAMLKIDADDLPTADWSTSPGDSVTPGQLVVAAGADEDPLAVGVVSVVRRPIPRSRGMLGVVLSEKNKEARIEEVMRESPAEKAGLKVDDVVIAVEGKAIDSREKLIDTIGSYNPGVTIKITIRRKAESEKTTEKEKEGEISSKEIVVTATLQGRQAPFQDRMSQSLSSRSDGFPAAVQHDTVLRPDQCGGPLVGLDGKVLGINIARAGRVVSYAIPSDIVTKLVSDFKSGKYAPSQAVAQSSSRQPLEVKPPKRPGS